MPPKKGTSQSAVSSNIKTLVDEWNKDGAIGASHPPYVSGAVRRPENAGQRVAGAPAATYHY